MRVIPGLKMLTTAMVANTADDTKNADQPEPIKNPEADLTNTSNDLTNHGDTNS